MSSRFPIFFLLLGSAGLAGCIPSAAPAPDPREAAVDAAVLEAPVAEVWGVLPEVYDSLGLEVSFTDSADHSLASTRTHDIWLPVIGPWSSPYAHCTLPALVQTAASPFGRRGGWGIGLLRLPPGQVFLSVETALAPTNGGTRVEVQLRASPVGGINLDPSGIPAEGPHCVSTGRLEQAIVEAIERRVGSVPPAARA